MTRAGTMVVVAVAAIGAGCMTSSRNAYRTSPATAHADTAASARTSGSQATTLCPMDVPGAHVATAETADGTALTFTTSASQPEARDQLRNAVRSMADTFNGKDASGTSVDMQHHAAAGDTRMGSTGSADASSEPMHAHAHALPASHASVEDVGEGIRLTVTPNDPADLDQLRGALRMRVDRMLQTGTCASP